MDHYSVLGVAKTATSEEIKKAYRKLASKHHPDKGGDTAQFQKIQTAYDILGDTNKRRQYDSPPPQGMHGNPQGFGFNTQGFDINSIFGEMFKQHRTADPFGRQQQQVFRTHLNISLHDVYTGSSQIVKLQSDAGVKVINIEIPPGVNHGDQMRYDNVIDNAILVVEFNILPDLTFDRKGQDLYCNQPVSVLDLIVGTTFEFTTISGKVVQVRIPAQTQPHMQLKLTGCGMPIMNTGQFGDQIILLKPFIPDMISEDIVDSILRSRAN